MHKSFHHDHYFLAQYHPDLIVLRSPDGLAQVAIVPAYQGRVMTSTATGPDGQSFGWINYDHIASGKIVPHMNVYGGEERFWMGPEGGQFALFFPPGVPFAFEHWQVPPVIDTEPFDTLEVHADRAVFEKKFRLTNYSGTTFDCRVERQIRLLDAADIAQCLGIEHLNGVQAVGFQSDNTLTNTGERVWQKETGLLSIWMSNMLNASDRTTVVIPYQPGDEATLGPVVTDDYFGKIPENRLQRRDGYLLFKADAQMRGKIGLSPYRAMPYTAAWDPENEVLSVAQYSMPNGNMDYVNALWEMQEQPYAGDLLNAYNDGINDTGEQMGRFFEIESSSPAAALEPGGSILHFHRMIHLQGNKDRLEVIARAVTGLSLGEMEL